MREANRFKEYERIPKNRIGGDYWNTYWTIRYMLHTIEDILAKGDKLVLLGFFTVEPKFYKEKKHVLEWKEQAKMNLSGHWGSAIAGVLAVGAVTFIGYKAKFKSGTVLNRACEAYGDYLKEETNNKDDEYEEGEEE